MAAWFTPEELEELARADAQIESRFTYTPEEIRDARLRDIRVKLDWYNSQLQQALFDQNETWYKSTMDRLKYWQNQLRIALEGETDEEREAKRKAQSYRPARQKKYYADNIWQYLPSQSKIREARLRRGLTQAEAANLMDISAPTLCKWEKGMLRADWSIVERVFGNIGPKH